MSGAHPVEAFDGLKFAVEPVPTPAPVYFTDQTPAFRVLVTNDCADYEFAEDCEFTWEIEMDGPTDEPLHAGTATFGPLAAGETEAVRIGGEPLAYEGHGVLSIGVGNAISTNGEFWRIDCEHQPETDPVYTFSVYNKHHYLEAHRRPRRLRSAILFASSVLILVAFVQVALAVM